MPGTPLVSVVIPVHNRPAMLERAVDSVLGQDFTDFELIVVDDGSTLSLEVVKDKLLSANQTYLRQARAGVACARNAGAKIAKGQWLAFLDSDDAWLPEKLSKQLAYMEANSELSLSQTKEIWFRHGKRVNPKQIHVQPDGDAFFPSLERCVVSASCIMIRSQLFKESGGFDEQLWVCEDYDLWLRLAVDYQIGLVDELLVEKYGGHADQLSRSQPVMDGFRVYSLLKLLLRTELSMEQRLAVVRELEKKTRVIALGAAKRGATHQALFAGIERFARKAREERGAENCRRQELEELSSECLEFIAPSRSIV